MDEFGFIRRLLAPLAGPGALGLTDDAALLSPSPGHALVLTKDALVEGVHFTGREAARDIARKALRVNLSDLAAMGACPRAYLLALMLPAYADETWLTDFAAGLAADQKEFAITLLGGDTTRMPGPLSLCVTMLGEMPQGSALTRGGAKAGDGIFVTGTIGDSALGLRAAQGEAFGGAVLQRYLLPQPRIALGQKLVGLASSCMDVSDGLAQDMGHIARASGMHAELQAAQVPLSDAVRGAVDAGVFTLVDAVTGGDDYELLFTAPPEAEPKLAALAQQTGVAVTRIGLIRSGEGVELLDETGAPITLTRQGWRHF